MGATTEERNREILEELLEGGRFRAPEDEYGYRSEDFEARMPQTGETFDRDSLMAMQKSMGEPPRVRVERMTGSGDLWVVETVNTYSDDGEYYACAIVEFADGKICRETRYYGQPIEVDRGTRS
jgi:hypothetical protein